jgi:hypothetical protein
MKRFCVNNSSNPDVARRAIVELKRTVRFGKRAEQALEALEREGHFDGKVAVFTRDCYYSAAVYRLPAYQPVSRDDIPEWDGVSVECGEKRMGHHGGAKFHTVPIYLSGTALLVQTNDKSVKVARKPQGLKIATAMLGECRLKSNKTVTFAANSRYRQTGSVFHIKRDIDETRYEAGEFANIVSQALVQFDGHDWAARSSIPQKILDLRAAVSEWLIEDGKIRQMFNSILDAIEVVRVMES